MPDHTTIWLVRHAEAGQPSGVSEPNWPLTATGHGQACHLADVLKDKGAGHLYASPFKRAQQTLMPLAAALATPIRIAHNLRERRLAGDLIDDFHSALRMGFADHDHCLPGGESVRHCRDRVTGVIDSIADKHQGSTVAVCSHGVAITAFLSGLDPSLGYEFWRKIGNPHLFRIDVTPNGMTWHDAGSPARGT